MSLFRLVERNKRKKEEMSAHNRRLLQDTTFLSKIPMGVEGDESSHLLEECQQEAQALQRSTRPSALSEYFERSDGDLLKSSLSSGQASLSNDVDHDVDRLWLLRIGPVFLFGAAFTAVSSKRFLRPSNLSILERCFRIGLFALGAACVILSYRMTASFHASLGTRTLHNLPASVDDFVLDRTTSEVGIVAAQQNFDKCMERVSGRARRGVEDENAVEELLGAQAQSGTRPAAAAAAASATLSGVLVPPPASDARFRTSANLVRDEQRTLRLVGLALPPRPAKSSTSFYSSKLVKDRDWDLWLRAKVKSVTDYLLACDSLGPFGWIVMVDDDTYVRAGLLASWLGGPTWHGQAHRPLAIGREFTRRVYPQRRPEKLIGGGPGIVMSVGALAAIRRANCTLGMKIISGTVGGGDGWLGQCFERAEVRLVHDWRFRSLPPFAYPPAISSQAFSFHKVVDLAATHATLASASASAAAAARPFTWPTAAEMFSLPATCVPVLPRGGPAAPQCGPNFVILGAQKAATTSLFGYLGQHPAIALPSLKNKELNFLGSPFPSSSGKYYASNSDFVFRYLKRFPLAHRTGANATVTGEASPDYLVAGAHAVVNALRFLPRAKYVVSLRDPVDRAVSAYENKVADGTSRKNLRSQMRVDVRGLGYDKRTDAEAGFVPPPFAELARRAGVALQRCPQRWHYTMNELPPLKGACRDGLGFKEGAEAASAGAATGAVTDYCRVACYVNPFVLHGAYARYLRPWFAAFPSGQKGGATGGAISQVLVLDYAALSSDPARALRRLCAFLGVDPAFAFDTSKLLNTRVNRVTGPAGQKARSASSDLGTAALDKETALEAAGVAGAFTWGGVLTHGEEAALRRYFAAPNADLARLLADEGQEPMTWIKL